MGLEVGDGEPGTGGWGEEEVAIGWCSWWRRVGATVKERLEGPLAVVLEQMIVALGLWL